MEKNDRIHIITGINEPAQPIVTITRDPGKERSAWLRGCCPTAFPFGDV